MLNRVEDYATKVLEGEIIAGPHVRNECRRYFDDLKREEVHFDLEAANRAFRFFEGKLKLSEGQFEGLSFKLAPAQAFIVGSLFGWKRPDGTRRYRRAYIEQGKGNGKALALDTKIPTPDGWKLMGDLQVGDRVFDEHGNPCNITGVTEVMKNHDCFLVKFSDGAEIIADAEHLWVTSALRTGLPKGPKPKGAPRKGMPAIRTTREISETLTVSESSSKHPQAKWNHRVDVAGATELPDADLPIPPYTLGAWLGDGNSDDSRFTLAYEDWETVENIRAEGVAVQERASSNPTTARVVLGSSGRSQQARNNSLQTKLRAEGLLGSKHIPDQYFWASKNQRFALLQGLMDTDGTITKAGQCELTLCNDRLAKDALILIRSLGFKPTLKNSEAKLNGKVVGRRNRIQFWAYSDTPVFLLKRKFERQKPRPKTKPISQGRMIVGCDPVASVPVRCISVDSPSNMYLASEHFVPTHNSPLAGGLGIYGLMVDHEPGAQIYAAGATKEQAGILFQDACKMVRASGWLDDRLKFSGGIGREFNIAHLKSGSFFRPVSRETKKTGSGPRPHFALIDELHEHPDSGVIEILERGFKFRRQPLLFMITNSGSDRKTVCWDEHMHAIRVASGNREAKDEDAYYVGDVIDDTTFTYVCALDPEDDPLEDEECWAKVNPLLDVTITRDYLRGVVAQAKAIPAKLNNIRRLHFCQWTDADTAWMTRAALEPCLHDIDPADYEGERVVMGCDLSQNKDITALGFIVKSGEVEIGENAGKPIYDAWVECFTPGDTLQERSLRDQQPYPEWVEAGWLTAPKGKSISYLHVAQAIDEADRAYDLQCLAYDRYAFRSGLEPEMDEIGLDVECVEHPQGGIKKGKPTERMIEIAEDAEQEPEGLWMPGSVRFLEDLIAEGRIRIQRNPVLVSAIMSSVTNEDRWGNYWLDKSRAANKIDAAVALCMAAGAAKALLDKPSPTSFWEDDEFLKEMAEA